LRLSHDILSCIKRDREIEILNGTLSSVIIILREREKKSFSPKIGFFSGVVSALFYSSSSSSSSRKKTHSRGEKDTKK